MTPLREWSLARWTITMTALIVILMFPIFTGLAFLQFGPVPYFLGVFLILLVVAIATGNRWVWLAEAIVLLLFAGLNAAFIVPELTRPDHYPDYILANVAILALPVSIVAAIAIVRETRKGSAPRAARLGSWGAVVALLVAGALIGMTTASVGLHGAPSAGTGTVLLTPDATVTVTTANTLFVPSTVSIPSGKIVKLSVQNTDPGLHKFNVDELHLDAELSGGKTTDLWLKADAPASYQLYCVLHASKGGDGKWTGMSARSR